MPGLYTLTYSVVSNGGYTVTASRQLYVYQAATITASLAAYSGLSSQSEADGLAAGLRNTSMPSYTTGVENIISKLGSVASQLEPGDVELTAPTTVQHGPQNYSVQVTAKVYMYLPKGVHRLAVAAFAKSLVANPGGRVRGAQRQLLATEPKMHGHMHRVANVGSLQPLADGGRIGSSHSPVTKALLTVYQSLDLLEQLVDTQTDCDPGYSDDCPDSTSTSRALPLAGVSNSMARKLLQSSQGSTSMASLLADLGTELGTAFTTQPLTMQSVDLLTVSCRNSADLQGL
jgi:hypothetical protein